MAKGITLMHPTWAGTRPMMDKVKQSLFSTIQAYTEQAKVLDMYAGSGSLALEALSRGAVSADFVDKSKRCCELIKNNLVKTKIENSGTVYCLDDNQFLRKNNEKYDIIFFCPPYAIFSVDKLKQTLGILNKDGVLVTEHPNNMNLPEKIESISLWKQKKFGQTILSFYA